MAVSGGAYQDLVDTYVLLGDPATRLPILRPDAAISMAGKKLDPISAETYVQYRIVFSTLDLVWRPMW